MSRNMSNYIPALISYFMSQKPVMLILDYS